MLWTGRGHSASRAGAIAFGSRVASRVPSSDGTGRQAGAGGAADAGDSIWGAGNRFLPRGGVQPGRLPGLSPGATGVAAPVGPQTQAATGLLPGWVDPVGRSGRIGWPARGDRSRRQSARRAQRRPGVRCPAPAIAAARRQTCPPAVARGLLPRAGFDGPEVARRRSAPGYAGAAVCRNPGSPTLAALDHRAALYLRGQAFRAAAPGRTAHQSSSRPGPAPGGILFLPPVSPADEDDLS